MRTEASVIEMKDLSIGFGRTQALNEVNLRLGRGRIVGLLGANGSGKSTLLRSVIGLYVPDAGTCQTLGHPADKLEREQLLRIGYVHQEGELLDWMKAGQLIRYVRTYYPTWNFELEGRYLREFQIDPQARVGNLSPGQRQRLAILLAVCHEPELLILDEPASGLDPAARKQLLDLLLGLIQDSQRTIIISSHILSDVEKVIDHVWILAEGRLVRDCAFDALKEEFIQLRLTSLEGALPAVLPFPGIVSCERTDNRAHMILQNASREEVEGIAATMGCACEFRSLPLEELYEHATSGKPEMAS